MRYRDDAIALSVSRPSASWKAIRASGKNGSHPKKRRTHQNTTHLAIPGEAYVQSLDMSYIQPMPQLRADMSATSFRVIAITHTDRTERNVKTSMSIISIRYGARRRQNKTNNFITPALFFFPFYLKKARTNCRFSFYTKMS